MDGDNPIFHEGCKLAASVAALWLASATVCLAGPAATGLGQTSHPAARNSRITATSRKPFSTPSDNSEAPKLAPKSTTPEPGNTYDVRIPDQPVTRPSYFEGGSFKIFLEEADTEGVTDAVAWTTIIGEGESIKCVGLYQSCVTRLRKGRYQVSVYCRCISKLALMIRPTGHYEPLAKTTRGLSATNKNPASRNALPGNRIGAGGQ